MRLTIGAGMIVAFSGCTGSSAAGGDGGSDLAGSISGPNMDVNWLLMDDDKNDQLIPCDEARAGVVKLDFTARLGSGAMAKTTAACPAGQAQGTVTISLPDNQGPFSISLATEGKTTAMSKEYPGITPQVGLTLTVYLFPK